jgi:hypothetical protein
LGRYVCCINKIMKKQIAKPRQTRIDFIWQRSTANAPGSSFEFKVPAGAKVPVTYYHEQFVETVYGPERIITFTVECKAVDITPGETCFIPRRAVYGSGN